MSNDHDGFLSFFICVLVMSPSNPKNFRSIARSISSEKRSIKSHPLLKDVSPLNTMCSLYGKENEAFKHRVTTNLFQCLCLASRLTLCLIISFFLLIVLAKLYSSFRVPRCTANRLHQYFVYPGRRELRIIADILFFLIL